MAELQQGGGRGTATPQEALALKFQTFSPLWEKTRSYALGINANDQSLTVNLVAGAGSDQDAKPVAETIQAMVTLGKNALQGLRQAAAGGEGVDWLLQTAASLLEKAQVETAEGFVHLSARSSVNLAEGIKLLVPAVNHARATARRARAPTTSSKSAWRSSITTMRMIGSRGPSISAGRAARCLIAGEWRSCHTSTSRRSTTPITSTSHGMVRTTANSSTRCR